MSDVFIMTLPASSQTFSPSGKVAAPQLPAIGAATGTGSSGPSTSLLRHFIPAALTVCASGILLYLKWKRRPALSPIRTPAARRVPSPHLSDDDTAADIEPGTPYVRMEKLGEGGFGVVYKARHARTGDLVAIKQSKEMDPHIVQELQREYQLIGGLAHANVVKVLGFEVDQRHARLYLEWCAGGSLADLIKRFPTISEALLRNYTRQILSGLKFLHDHGILHRDIKPRNILVDHKGVLKLTDFGLSRHIESMADRTKMCGTPRYMAPECPSGKFSFGSDIWAVGATLTELVSRTLPWSHLDKDVQATNMSLLFHIGNFRGNPLHHPIIPTSLSAEAQDFLATCFQQDPQARGTCDSLLMHPFLLVEDREEAGGVLGETFASSRSVVTMETISSQT